MCAVGQERRLGCTQKGSGIIVQEGKLTAVQMEECLKQAYTYENRAGHDKEHLQTSFIGRLVRPGGRIVDLYQDTSGSYWFKELRDTPDGIVTLEEAIFGRKAGRKKW